MIEFETLDENIRRLPLDRQESIHARSKALALEFEASAIKGKEAKTFGEHLREFGAHLFMRMPDGSEVEIQNFGAHA